MYRYTVYAHVHVDSRPYITATEHGVRCILVHMYAYTVCTVLPTLPSFPPLSLPQKQAGLRSSLPRSAAQLCDAIQELLNLVPGQRQFQEALKKMREVSNSVETGQVRGREER